MENFWDVFRFFLFVKVCKNLEECTWVGGEKEKDVILCGAEVLSLTAIWCQVAFEIFKSKSITWNLMLYSAFFSLFLSKNISFFF